MTPIVHGRVYPESESSELLSHTFRVLLDPQAVCTHERVLLDIDTLRIYLRDISAPCLIHLLVPAQPDQPTLSNEYGFLRRLGVDELPSSLVAAPKVASALSESAIDSDLLALASTASFGDADIVVSEQWVARPEAAAAFQRLNIQLVNFDAATRACEIFVRGYEVPWSFLMPIWRMPWTTFYAMVEQDLRKMEEFRQLAMRKGITPATQERIRSVGLNRWSAIAYARDKLLFYMIQRRRAKRHELERQGFVFELTYHLTSYFLLFWGALDQFSWIVNEVCGLGFTDKEWREVGVAKKRYLDRLRARDVVMTAIFQEPEFLRWLEVLRQVRHYVAHEGTAMLSPLLEKPKPEPSTADIDREIESSPEWLRLARFWPAAMMEAFRSVFRVKYKMKKYRVLSDAAFVLQGATDTAILFPLDNIEWEYERFQSFALAVVARCSELLSARPDTPTI